MTTQFEQIGPLVVETAPCKPRDCRDPYAFATQFQEAAAEIADVFVTLEEYRLDVVRNSRHRVAVTDEQVGFAPRGTTGPEAAVHGNQQDSPCDTGDEIPGASKLRTPGTVERKHGAFARPARQAA
jgi:hypothetical protein